LSDVNPRNGENTSVSTGRDLIGRDEAVNGNCDWTSVRRANPCQRQWRSLEMMNVVAEKNYELLVLAINEVRQMTAFSLEKWLMKIGVNK